MPKNFFSWTRIFWHKYTRWLPPVKKIFPITGIRFPHKRKCFPNDIFHQETQFNAELLSQWTVFSSQCFLLPKVILVAYFYHSSWNKNNHFRFSKTEKTNINNCKRKRRSVPVYRHCKFREWKINGSYLSALIWVSKRIKCRYSGIKMHGGYQNAFLRRFCLFFEL